MKNQLKSFLILIVFSNYYSCEYSPDEPNPIIESERLVIIQPDPILNQDHFRRITEPLVIPTYVHIYRPNNGDGTPTDQDVNTALETLIAEYAIHNIEVCIAKTEIVNKSLDIISSGEDSRVAGYLNVSLGQTFLTNPLIGGGQAGGANGALGEPTDFIGLAGNHGGISVLYDQTIVHEVGHCFSLFHSSNETNIMLTRNTGVPMHGNVFNSYQVDRMINSIRSSEVHNQWHKYLLSESIIHKHQVKEATFDLYDLSSDIANEVYVTNWAVSPNLKIVSKNANKLTYTPQGLYFGKGWINATIQVSGCQELSLCKEISYTHQGLPQHTNGYVNYYCNSEVAECIGNVNCM